MSIIKGFLTVLFITFIVLVFALFPVSAADGDALAMKVTVPSVLPVAVSSDGTTSVANRVEIINESDYDVQVDAVVLNPSDDWRVVAMDTDFKKVPVDTKQYGFMLNGVDFYNKDHRCLCDLWEAFPLIEANSSLLFNYDARIAVQSTTFSDMDIGHVVFTIAKADS